MAARILLCLTLICSFALAWTQPRLNGAFDHDRGTLAANVNNPGTGSLTFTNTNGASVTYTNTLFASNELILPTGTEVLLIKSGSYPLAYSWPTAQRFVYAEAMSGPTIPAPVDAQGKLTKNVAFFSFGHSTATFHTNPAVIGTLDLANGIEIQLGVVPNSFTLPIPGTAGEGLEGSADFTREFTLLKGRVPVSHVLQLHGIAIDVYGRGSGAVPNLRLGIERLGGVGNRTVDASITFIQGAAL